MLKGAPKGAKGRVQRALRKDTTKGCTTKGRQKRLGALCSCRKGAEKERQERAPRKSAKKERQERAPRKSIKKERQERASRKSAKKERQERAPRKSAKKERLASAKSLAAPSWPNVTKRFTSVIHKCS